MAEVPQQGASEPPTSKAKEKSRSSKAKSSSSQSSSALKEAERRIKALEEQLDAQRQTPGPQTHAVPASGQNVGTTIGNTPPGLPEGMGAATDKDWSPDRFGGATQVAEPPPRSEFAVPSTSAWHTASQQLPSATFTPTAAGLHSSPDTWQRMPPALQDMIASAYSHGIAAGVQQYSTAAVPPPSPQPSPSIHRNIWAAPAPESPTHDSRHEDYEFREHSPEPGDGLSEDEGAPPEPPAYAGLFRPSIYRVLLNKAKLAVALGTADKPTDPATATQPATRVFAEPLKDSDFIPSPKLFLDNVKRPWQHPASALGPTASERKFYAFDPELENLLEFPSIDAPVAGLVSNALVPSEMADGLKPDDRRAETLIKKAHQMNAWALKAASAASFFNRASVVWLQDMLNKLGPEDGRLRQDINKLLAAAEFSADATLSASRFSSRALAANVSSRRLLWLRTWQADAKSKWRLASAPFDGSKLFGECLDKVLIEDKDKKKILPRTYRRQDRRTTPYFRRQPFRAEASSIASQGGRAYNPGSFSQSSYRTDRSNFGDRNRQFQQPRKSFRGSNRGGFRRNK